MGNLVPAGNTALAPYGGVNPWAEAARGVDTGAYLKFNGNSGDITFGSDDEALPVGSRIVVDMQSLAFGWQCWSESQCVEEIFVPVTEGKPPLEHELKDHGPYDDEDDGWREAASFSAVLLEFGEDPDHETVGTKLLFKTCTGGPVRSTKKLSGAYGKLFMQHMDELPIVELSTESYMPKVKKHGKKWALLFKIVDWINEDELAGLALGTGDDEGDYEPEPVAKKGRAAPVAEEPAPRRRAAAAAPAEEAPAPRRRAAAPAPIEEEEEEVPAPAPRRRTTAAPASIEEEEEEVPAPAPRRRAAAPPVEEDEGEEDVAAPAPRRRAAAADTAPAEDDEGDVAPEPRGRSAGRAAPNARMRRFES